MMWGATWRSVSVAAVAAATTVVTLGPSAWGQEWCGEDCWNIDIDAQLGFESLQEPDLDSATQELESNGYVTVNASALLQAYNIQALIQGPLRFITEDFSLREQDWDEANEFLRIFRCARVDFFQDSERGSQRLRETGSCLSWTPSEAVGDVSRREADFTYYSARLHPLFDYTLGYGSIISGYNAMLEEDHFREGVSGEVNLNRTFLLAAALSDISDPTVGALRLAVRPVQNAQIGDKLDGSGFSSLFLEIGATGATDFQAPSAGGDELLGIVGGDARLRYTDQVAEDMTMVHPDDYKVIRLEVGSEFNQIVDFGFGLHNHLRFYYDVGEVDFFIDGEHRMLSGQYIPVYFNQHYRVQRSQYVLSDDQRAEMGTSALSLTKRDFLASLPDETEHAYAFTATFRLWLGEGLTHTADLSLFAEQTPGRDLSGRAGATLTIFNIDDKLTVFGTFVQQGWDDLGGLFAFGNSVLDLYARYWITEQIYLDPFYEQTWFQLDTGNYDTTHDFGMSLGFERQ